SYRIYRSQDRYSFDREHNFLAEVPASQLSYLDTSTTGTPGEPEAYFYVIETVFGPNAGTPEGESHVLHPVTPIVDRNGLFTRTSLLQATSLPTSTVSITAPGGTVYSSSAAGNGLQLASVAGADLVDGDYLVTVTGTVSDFFQVTVSGNGDFS